MQMMLCAVTHGDEGSKSTHCISDAMQAIWLLPGGLHRIVPTLKETIMVELLLVIILVIIVLRLV